VHLADLLFADRRWRDSFAAGIAPEPPTPWNKLDSHANKERRQSAGRRSRAEMVDLTPMPCFHTNSMRA
jgi:hypothetical protein